MPVPAVLEYVLAIRRLPTNEVLRIGLLVCDHWRRHGVELADIRSRNLALDYDGALVFGNTQRRTPEPEYVGLRALGGLLARALDRTHPSAGAIAPFLESLAGAPPEMTLVAARAEIHQQLARTTSSDPLDAQTLAEDPPSVSYGVLPPQEPPDDIDGPTYVPVAGPGGSTTDPYADTLIKFRDELAEQAAIPQPTLMGDPPTDAALQGVSMPVVPAEGPPPSLAAELPGPAAEPMPTGINELPPRPMTSKASRVVLALGVIVFGLAVAAALFVR